MPNASSPIGIFDSGVGGLTVARAVMEQLPQESVIYKGDTAHGPYGPRPISQVRAFSQDIADELVERGCKMLVIACNTATAAFLHDAREHEGTPGRAGDAGVMSEKSACCAAAICAGGGA